MDLIALGWRGDISESLIQNAIIEFGLNFADLSSDAEVNSGLEECRQALSLVGVCYLVESNDDPTSNKLTWRVVEEIEEGREPCLSRLGKFILERTEEGEIWFLFAHDWPKGINVTYLEGIPDDLTTYIRLNGGVYRLLRSFSTGAWNVDLDVPLVWKLVKPPHTEATS